MYQTADDKKSKYMDVWIYSIDTNGRAIYAFFTENTFECKQKKWQIWDADAMKMVDYTVYPFLTVFLLYIFKTRRWSLLQTVSETYHWPAIYAN